MSGQTDGETSGRTDRETDGQTDRQTDGVALLQLKMGVSNRTATPRECARPSLKSTTTTTTTTTTIVIAEAAAIDQMTFIQNNGADDGSERSMNGF